MRNNLRIFTRNNVHPKNLRKIRIFSLERKNNILTKKGMYDHWDHWRKDGYDHWRLVHIWSITITECFCMQWSWRSLERDLENSMYFSVWIRLCSLCSLVPAFLKNCAGVNRDGESFCGIARVANTFELTYSFRPHTRNKYPWHT